MPTRFHYYHQDRDRRDIILCGPPPPRTPTRSVSDLIVEILVSTLQGYFSTLEAAMPHTYSVCVQSDSSDVGSVRADRDD